MTNKKRTIFLTGLVILAGLAIFQANQAQAYSSDRYLLWSNDNGGASLWSLDANDNYNTYQYYNLGGSTAGWLAVDYSQSENGSVRYLLWTKDDGSAVLWTLDSNNNYLSSQSYAFGSSGWHASTYYRNESGSVRYLLWTNGNGQANLWTLNTSDNYVSGKSYSYSGTTGWTATDYYRNEDGSVRYMLWSNPINSWTAMWILNTNNDYAGYKDYGREAGWLAIDYHKNVDDSAKRLLWSKSGGSATFWFLDSNNNYIGYKDYSSAGWQARRYWSAKESLGSGYVQIISPNGGETWQRGKSYNLHFSYGSLAKEAQVYLFKGSNGNLTSLGSTISLTSSPVAQSVYIPSDITIGSDYKIMVRVFNSSGAMIAEDYSDNNLSIVAQSSTTSITVESPNGGEIFSPGTVFNIKYATLSEINTVHIYLYQDNVWRQTIGLISNLGSGTHYHSWFIPSYLSSASNYKIKIVDYYNSSVYDESDNYFTIFQSGWSGGITDGSLIRNSNAWGDARFDIYIVKLINNKKFKRLILSPKVFLSYGHLNANSVISVDQATMDSYLTSDLVRASGDSRVYKLYASGDGGEKRWIRTIDAFNRYGYDWDAIYLINTTERDEYWMGSTIE